MAYTDLQTRSTLAAYFATHAESHAALDELRAAGFKAEHVGIASRQNPATAPANTTTAATTSSATNTEGTWAKIKNFFEGNEPEPYADESRRGAVESHEITPGDGFSGTSAAAYDEDGYNTSDVHNSLSQLDIPEEHARYFGHRMGRGEEGVIVTVHPHGRDREAEEILVRNGGDLGSGAAEYGYDEPETTGANTTGSAQRIQLLGEVLRVHKERISSGEVRLRKEVITEQQTIQVPVSHEELVVERIAGDGLTPVTGTIGADSEIRVPLSQEVASVDKQTVVREQVGIGTRTVEGVQNLNSEVQHEELRIGDESIDSK